LRYAKRQSGIDRNISAFLFDQNIEHIARKPSRKCGIARAIDCMSSTAIENNLGFINEEGF